MNIEDILNMWDQDAAIDNNYLGEASTGTPNLHAKYVRLLMGAKLKLSKTQIDYNELRQVKFRYYRGEMSKTELAEREWDQYQGIKPLKNEMDEILKGDADLNQMWARIEYMENMVYALESILTQIKSRDFQISNGIKWKTFLAGN